MGGMYGAVGTAGGKGFLKSIRLRTGFMEEKVFLLLGYL